MGASSNNSRQTAIGTTVNYGVRIYKKNINNVITWITTGPYVRHDKEKATMSPTGIIIPLKNSTYSGEGRRGGVEGKDFRKRLRVPRCCYPRGPFASRKR